MRRVFVLLVTLLLAGCARDEGAADDQDGDLLRDDLEARPRSITVSLKGGVEERLVASDPTLVDTDGDGLSDADEFVRGTDPSSLDTDQDGLLDGYNISLPATSAQAAQFRAMGLIDQPPGNFLGELGLCPGVGGLRPTEWSSDRPVPDALGDGEEFAGWNVTVRGQTRAVVSDPCTSDLDQDGLPDDDEREAGTDPRLADTDSDGARDGVDADPLWDLGIRVENLTASVRARLTFSLSGTFEEALVPPPAARIETDVTDGAADLSSLLVVGGLFATDQEGTAPLFLFPDGSRTELHFDLVKATLIVGASSFPEGPVALEGSGGGVTFTWRVTRT